MLFQRSYVRREKNPSGKFVQHDRPGVQRFSQQSYHGWKFDIWRRNSGVVVKRVHYSASIRGPKGERAAYLIDFRTSEQARQAAESWIDEARKMRDPWGPRWREKVAKLRPSKEDQPADHR